MNAAQRIRRLDAADWPCCFVDEQGFIFNEPGDDHELVRIGSNLACLACCPMSARTSVARRLGVDRLPPPCPRCVRKKAMRQ